MNNINFQDEFLDCKSFAAATKLSTRLFWQLIKDGKLTAYRPSPRRTLVKRADVKRWIESSRSENDLDKIVDEVLNEFAL